MSEKKSTRDIGLDVPIPKETCSDKDCPFHGTLPVRGQVFTGVVVSNKMDKTVVVEREYTHFIPKYERYEKRTSRNLVHCPPCIKVDIGDKVKFSECRPLSKAVSFVVVQKL
ncbi:MAG TPA: 30S ribosomal protein S17 [Thermoplasmatales archaeon]|nr:30S ribosomal protein S17 [Thermoplasmatales archaeon]